MKKRVFSPLTVIFPRATFTGLYGLSGNIVELHLFFAYLPFAHHNFKKITT